MTIERNRSRPSAAQKRRPAATKSTGKQDGAVQSGTRLNVFLQERGVASRRKADELIAAGRVTVNGKVVSTLGARVTDGATVCVDGKQVKKVIPNMTFLFNKPDMCITSRNDPQGRRTIFDLAEVKKLPSNVQAVGRLDFRSEGLLILTNDGDLAYALTHPKFSVEKRYACLLSDTINPEEIENLRKGVVLDDGLARPVAVRLGGSENIGGKRGRWVEVIVTEGRNRLVRRMFEALGHKVIRLVRVSIGDIDLPLTLKPEHIVPLEGDALHTLQRLRDEFVNQSGSKSKSTKTPLPKQRKPRSLNDEDYAYEMARRSRDTEERRRKRIEQSEQQTRTPAKRKPSGTGNSSTIRGEKGRRPTPRNSR